MALHTKLPLADPLYHRLQVVDLLLGADILPLLHLEGKTSGHTGEPVAIETFFQLFSSHRSRRRL